MKKIFTIEAIVGLFALAGLAIIIYMSLEVSETNIARGRANTYTAKFDSVTGVVNKSPIETAGIRVGFIDSIELEKDKARVTVKVIPDLPLYKNAKLWIKDRGILGDRFLKLDPGTPDYPKLGSGDEIINTYSESDLDKMMSSLGGAAENLDKMMKSLGEEGDKGSFSTIINNLKELSGNLNDIFRNNKNAIDSTLTNLKDITDSLKLAMGRSDDAKATGESLRNAIKKLETAMESFDRIAAKIDKGEGTIGKLVSDEQTAKKVGNAIDGLSEYVDSARKIQTSVSYRGEYLTQTEKFQHVVGIKVQPKPDKYLEFQVIDTPAGRTNVTTTSVYIPPSTTPIAQSTTVDSSDRFVFSLELAKRFYDLNLRFGILRSKGGVGFDYYFLNDLLKFSFEAFDFSRYENRPQLRSYATFTFFKHLLLTGGVNDMIVKEGNRDYFFGAGFSFTDNDLKTILTSFKIPGL